MLQQIYRCLIILLLTVGIQATSPALAQEASAAGADASNTEAPAPQPDPYGRETPRGSISGLLSALASRNYQLAGNYFEKKTNPADLAERLQAALDAGGSLIPFSGLSKEEAGNIEDGLPPDREHVGTLGGENEVPIELVRLESEEGKLVWLIAADTLRALPLAESETDGPDSEQLMIAGAPIKDWLVLLGIAAVAFGAFQFTSFLVLWGVGRVISDPKQSAIYRFSHAAIPPLSLLLSVIAFQIWAESLPVSIVARQILLRYIGAFAWLALAWFLVRMVDALSKLVISRMEDKGRRQTVSVITLIRRGVKVLLLFGALVAVLDAFDIDVTAGLAALGIGGIALALGAQKTVENLVGSLTLIADNPVQVGDFCRVGDVQGTVEDIGIRSTRIRTLDRTIVTIPNGDFSSQQIENYAKRDQFLFNPVIGLEYGIGSKKLLEAVEAVEAVLEDHARIIKPGARARFTRFGASSLDIEVFAYIRAADFDESLVIQQDLLFTIFARLEALDVSIAIPTRNLHIGGSDAPLRIAMEGDRAEASRS